MCPKVPYQHIFSMQFYPPWRIPRQHIQTHREKRKSFAHKEFSSYPKRYKSGLKKKNPKLNTNKERKSNRQVARSDENKRGKTKPQLKGRGGSAKNPNVSREHVAKSHGAWNFAANAKKALSARANCKDWVGFSGCHLPENSEWRRDSNHMTTHKEFLLLFNAFCRAKETVFSFNTINITINIFTTTTVTAIVMDPINLKKVLFIINIKLTATIITIKIIW